MVGCMEDIPLAMDAASHSPAPDQTPPPPAQAPEIALEPLHVLDPLSIKWGLGRAGSAPAAPEPAHTAPTPGEGYVRLLGLLFDGRPWECSILLADMARPGGVSIGRDPACCEILLDEASISRRHASFELTYEGIIVADADSTNGTFLNSRRLTYPEHRAPLTDGCQLTLGDITLRVEIFSQTS